MKFGRRAILRVRNLERERVFDSREFRMTFRTRRTLSQMGSVGACTVWNLSGTTEDDMLERNNGIIFSAGYTESVAEIYRGNVMRSDRGREGPDRYFTLFFRSGVAMTASVVNLSFAGRVSVWTIIREIVDKISQNSVVFRDIRLVENSLLLIPSDTTVLNWRYTGPASTALSNLLIGLRIPGRVVSWVLDGTHIRITELPQESERAGEQDIGVPATQDVEVHRLSEESGMVSVPARQDDGLRVATLLSPEIQLDQRVQIDPPPGTVGRAFYADEIYRVVDVVHHGDTWHGDYLTELEARPIA